VPAGYSERADDCDDERSDINPSAPERCDNLDNDCDPTTTEADAVDAKEWFPDVDGDGYGDPLRAERACAPVAGFIDQGADCDDADADTYPGAPELCVDGDMAENRDNDCDTVVDEECPAIHCGQIDRNTMWDASTEHLVTCPVFVNGPSRPRLTVLPGTKVAFLPGASLRVGSMGGGSISAIGTEDLPIVFTSHAETPSAGDWDGVVVGKHAQTSYLQHIEIGYGGHVDVGATPDDQHAALRVSGVELDLEDIWVHDSASHGLTLKDSQSIVRNSTFENNAWHGIECRERDCFRDVEAVVSGNTFRFNGRYPLTLGVESIAGLGPGNIYEGNTTDKIYVAGGELTQPARWRGQDVPYLVHGDLKISEVLTIGGGAVFEMTVGSRVSVGRGGDGGLITEAGGDVVFRGEQPSAGPGHWRGIEIEDRAVVGELRDLTVSDAEIGILVESEVAVEADGLHVQDSRYSGLVANDATIHITNSSFVDNLQYGVEFWADERDQRPTLSDSVMSGNGHPAAASPAAMSGFDASNDYTGNSDNRVVLLSSISKIAGTHEWTDLGVPLFVPSGMDIWSSSDNPVKLVLNEGLRIELGSNRRITLFFARGGRLVVRGDPEAGKPVVLSGDPGTGASWRGLKFQYSTEADIDGLEVRDVDGIGIEVAGGFNHSIRNTSILDSAGAGINLTSFSTIALSDVEIRNIGASGINGTAYGLGLDPCYFTGLSFENVEIADIAGAPLSAEPCAAEHLAHAPGISFSGSMDDGIYVSGFLDEDAVWKDFPMPVLLDWRLQLSGDDSPTLTLDGMELRFFGDAVLMMSAITRGRIHATDTVFTSANANPAAGDWCGISVGVYGSAMFDDVEI